jgi:parallel beta-helix repeat protein
MKRKILWSVILFLGLLLSSSHLSDGKIIQVGKTNQEFHSIQDAIDNASSDDKIIVYNGTYDESIDIYKKISIQGIDFPVVTTSESDDIISLTADLCRIAGLKIINGEDKSYSGINIESDGNRIENNIIKNNKGNGIYIFHSKDTVIINNSLINDSISIVGKKNDWQSTTIVNTSVNHYPVVFYKNKKNISISYEDLGQIILVNCENCTIHHNRIVQGDQGITIGYSGSNWIHHNTFLSNEKGFRLQYSDNNTVESNHFEGNEYGLYITHSFGNIIRNNTFLMNKEYGCWLCCNSNDNVIYRNRFLSNGNAAYDIFENDWFYHGVGNYWDDYTGVDKNNDGIGDSSYQIPPAYASAEDPYPIIDFDLVNQDVDNESNAIPVYFLLILVFLIALKHKNLC